jgi:predicted metal-dependent phosphoesterase TrpH
VRARAGGAIGRPHVADALIAAGHAADRREAFERFLADGRPAAVPHRGLEPLEAVRLVVDSGGAASLAHPASLAMSPSALEAFVQRLAAAGMRGIEVHRADHTPELRDLCAGIARRRRLVATGGSDFHDPDGDAVLGDTGIPPLPADVLDRLLPGG